MGRYSSNNQWWVMVNVRNANAKCGNGTTLFCPAHSPYQAQTGFNDLFLSLCPTMTELVHKNYLTAATWSSCLRLRKAWSGQVAAGLDLIWLFWSMALVSNFILLLQSYIKEFRRKRVLS